MSKELTEQPCEELFTPPKYSEQMNNYLVNLCEKLENERDIAYKIADHYRAERDALLADNARLLEALERMRVAGGSQEFHMAWELAKDLLAATPAQSLARYHNEALEKAEKVCEQATTIGACIAAIRELKEPE